MYDYGMKKVKKNSKVLVSKKRETTLDDLARAIASGFEGVDKRFEGVDKRFEGVISEMATKSELMSLRTEMQAGFEKVGIQIGQLANKAFEDRTEVSTLARKVERFDTRLRVLEKQRS